MKKILILITLIFISLSAFSQDIKTERIIDWNTLRKPGFYESVVDNAINTPAKHPWYWGINIAHSPNSTDDRNLSLWCTNIISN